MKTSLVCFIVAAIAGSALPANAALPDPTESEVDPCLVVCPYGDIGFRVIVRDINHSSVPGATVNISYGSCGDVSCVPEFCSPLLTDGYTLFPEFCVASKVADGAGEAMFNLRAGGGAPNQCIEVTANGILLASAHLASTDQNGDLQVTESDIAALTELETNDPTNPAGDLDCNATVDASDIALAEAHLGHHCEGPVQARASSWGMLKAFYR